MKNYLGQSLALSALVMVFLVLLSMVSRETSIAGIELRRMDIFSDVRHVSPEVLSEEPLDSLYVMPDTTLLAGDTLVEEGNVPRPVVDSALWGQRVEDYTFNESGLSPFFSAVARIADEQKKVRVAFFGDSFIEGDILLGDLRDSLQSVWGGEGVGYVPFTSEISRFRRTFLQRSKGAWRSWSIVNNEGNTFPLGVNGHVYIPGEDAGAHFDGTHQYGFGHTARWSDVRMFYRAGEGVSFIWQTNLTGAKTAFLPATKKTIGLWETSYPGMESFSTQFPQTNHLQLYGLSFESGPGIYFDNFSTRGNSGGKLRLIQPEMYQAFDEYQHYDLIVLQFGLNAVTNSLRNIKWYEAELDKMYAHIRTAYPHTPVLVMSVPDRGGKVNGVLTTMISVPYIVEMQRQLARKHGFLFYDFYRGMGGYNSMVALAAASHPTLVNKDYTHLTHEGGRYIGRQLAGLFLREYQFFIQKNQ